jgi:hypothetical protein
LTPVGSASATLLDRGPGFVYDDVLDITWTRNANLAGSSGLDWVDATAWATNLVLGGFDDWRLASGNTVQCNAVPELACRSSELGYMFYHDLGGTFPSDKTGTQTALGGEQLTGIQQVYWGGPDSASVVQSVFAFDAGVPFEAAKTNQLSAWAVRDGDVGAVPEPSSLLLIGIGVGGFLSKRLVSKRTSSVQPNRLPTKPHSAQARSSISHT